MIGIGDRITIRYPDEYSAAGFNEIDSYIVSIDEYWGGVPKIWLSNGDSLLRYGDYWHSEKLGLLISYISINRKLK